MPARMIIFAALACFLPALSAQSAKPAAPTSPPAQIPVKNLPVLTDQAVVIDKEETVLRYAKDGSSVRTLFVSERVLSDAGCAVLAS